MDCRSFVKTKTFALIAALIAVALIVGLAFVVASQIEDDPVEYDKTPDNVFSWETESYLG